jgi:nitric oxide reductase NorQ protein
MSRVKSDEAVLIENVLTTVGGHVNYRAFARTGEYTDYMNANPGKVIGEAFFNSVKSRWMKNTATVAAGVSATATWVPENVAPKKASFSYEPSPYQYKPEIEMMVPSIDNNFVVSEENESLIDLVQKRSTVSNVNVRLVGPAGCGKTSFAINYAANRKMPAMVMDCANVREPRDWFGYRKFDPSTKEIVWHESMFIRMIETPGTVVVLDELNRVSPMVINTLIPLLDHRRQTYLEEANRSVKCAEGVSFWAAINEGNQFTGTITLDEAISDRFGLVVECKFLDAKTEAGVLKSKTGLDIDSCRKLVEVANQVRTKSAMDAADAFSKPISTRMLEEAATAMVIGGVKTLSYSLLNHFSAAGGPSSEREGLRKLLVGKFGSI